MSSLITFTGLSFKTGNTFRGSANINIDAPWDVQDFVEELSLLEDGELIFNEGENADNLPYDSVADFVQNNPKWFYFYDENRDEINPDEAWGYFDILSF